MKRAFFLAALLPLQAFAYNEAVHSFLTRHALPPDRPVSAPTQEDLDAFRALFYVRAAENEEFARRYPTIHDFGAWEMKQFFMLDPAARVHGFDLAPDDAAGTISELLVRASRWPDDDERNRHRYLRDPRTHEIARAPDGSPLPYDPATLDFGSLSGTTSQGHAHYGLVEGPLSDDPDVLKKGPWRFAVPPTAHAYGPELVQLYTDLAALAAESGLPSAEWLQGAFAGAAFHHLQDVCNQIHTVQVGIYEFFEAAFIQSKLRDLKTLGGVFGERRSLAQVGLRLIANHHLLSEDLLAKHLGELKLVIDDPDPEIAAARTWRARSSTGRAGKRRRCTGWPGGTRRRRCTTACTGTNTMVPRATTRTTTSCARPRRSRRSASSTPSRSGACAAPSRRSGSGRSAFRASRTIRCRNCSPITTRRRSGAPRTSRRGAGRRGSPGAIPPWRCCSSAAPLR